MGFRRSQVKRPFGRWLMRVFAPSLLVCLMVIETRAQTSGRAVLNNGAVVEWRVDEGDVDGWFGFAAPAFAQWRPGGVDKTLTIAMRTNAMAAIDAWEMALYRIGDTRFERPLRRFRGIAPFLDQGLEWDGTVDDGPPLRPGERIMARLSIRDVAGNVAQIEPQEILIARYRMRRERQKLQAIHAERGDALAAGNGAIRARPLLRGPELVMRIMQWPSSDAPSASGAGFTKTGDTWTMRQIMAPGRHDIVIQSIRPILGGVRAIPVGVVSVETPADAPFSVAVKGTGRLAIMPVGRAVSAPEGLVPEGNVPGKQAISRILTNRDTMQDRLALALLDADRPALLVKDHRDRRAFLSSYRPSSAPWPGGAGGKRRSRSPDAPSMRRVSVRMIAPTGPELFLPHTDVSPDSITLSVMDNTGPLTAFRDYFPNPSEGRILLGAPVLSRLNDGGATGLTVSYTVPSFAPETLPDLTVSNGGASYNTPWMAVESAPSSPQPPAVAARDDGVVTKLLLWLFGG